MKVRIILSALTRVEHCEVVEIPDNTPAYKLDELVRNRYDSVPPEDFSEDWEYWERGDCYWEEADSDEKATGVVDTSILDVRRDGVER